MRKVEFIRLKVIAAILLSCSLITGCSTMQEEEDLIGTNIGSFEDFGDDPEEDEFGDSSIEDSEEKVAESSAEAPASSPDSEKEVTEVDDFSEGEELSGESEVQQKNAGQSENEVAQNENAFDEFSEPPALPESTEQEAPQALPPVSENTQEESIAPTLPGDSALAPDPDLENQALSESAPIEPETASNQIAGGATDSVSTSSRVKVTDMQYRINDQGGTFIIQATGPIEFSQKLNPQTNQVVIELINATLPRKLRRPFNTKDFPGQIGYIDAYQMKGANAPRIVIQLRAGASEPVIQSEGSALYVVSQSLPTGNDAEESVSSNDDKSEVSQAEDVVESSLFASENFEEFLRSNQKFTGKRISIETDEMELRDIFKLVSEEAGVNLVLADDVRGKMSLKLRSVPWDQALVMIMRAKKLGYTRSGSIIRVAPIAEIRTEEEDAIRIETAKRNNQPAIVKTITINYAKVEDLERQIRPLLSPRGAVVGDPRTSSIVVTDVTENVERSEALVKSLDIPPQQVLIEGKIVEASDNFERRIGINWSATGRPTNLGGGGANGPLRLTPGLSVTPGVPVPSSMGLNFALGTLDVLGDLTASLRLFELQGLVKVISSPRILTLHNETAEIGQTTEIPLITSNIQPNGATTPIVNFKPVQLRLSVVPQVTNDGAIIMGVDMTREVPGEIVDAETNARPINSRSAKTKVLLKNSQTAVIGGIYQNDTTESESRVPGLAKVPVIGWLFKNRSIDRKRTELLIFLTPRILGQMQSLPAAAGSLGLPDSPSINALSPEDTSQDNTEVDSAIDLGDSPGDPEEGDIESELNE